MAISKDTSLKMLEWFKEALDENLDAKLVTLSGGGGELNIIEAISIDGTPQPVTGKTAQLDLSAYAKKTDVTSAISTITGGTTIVSGASYTLKPATTSQLGGVIVGDGLGVNSNGTLRVTLSGGQSNVIESIFIDGTPQTVTGKTAQLDLSAYAKKADLTSAGNSIQTLKKAIETIADGKVNVIENISLDDNPQPIDANKTAILGLSAYVKKSDLAGRIRMKGSVTSANLPTKTALVGDLYNVKNDYTASDGTPIKAGTNVVFTADGKWDAMAGYLDTSNLVQKVTGKQLSTNDFTDDFYNKLTALSNYILPSASKTSLGGFMVGAGLSMTGDSLNADICNVFEGATSLESGDVGLVPAPKTGEQLKFLCSDGTWRVPLGENINIFASGYTPDALAVDVLSYSSEDMTLEASSPPTNTQGALYMGIVQDECCLKLFSGDYEYTFNPDVFDIATVKPPPPADFVQGKIYYLNTAPSAANGTLWYTANNKELPTLCAHREDADYTCNFQFNFDVVKSETIYSYLTFKSSTQDLMGCTWSTSITEPVIEETDFGIRALRNMNKSLANTVSTSSGWTHTFPSAKTVFTIDFWLSWNEDTAAVVGVADTSHSILTLRVAYTNGDIASAILGEKNNSLGIKEATTTTSEFLALEADIFNDNAAKRLHIALTHKSGENIKLYIDGKYKTTINPTSNLLKIKSLPFLTIFPYMVGTETGYRGLYIDHFRIRNEVVWDEDFAPPQEDDYIIW